MEIEESNRDDMENNDAASILQGEECLSLKRQKRALKSKLTKLRHHVEKSCLTSNSETAEVENSIEQLWNVLEDLQEVFDELSRHYLSVGDSEKHIESTKESDLFEKEIVKAIEDAHAYVKTKYSSASFNTIETEPQASNVTHTIVSPNNIEMIDKDNSHKKVSSSLQPLKIPCFDGDKAKFEEFWLLFESLVDLSDEPENIKMARLRQSLTGEASDAIRGLGITSVEYEEVKSILKSKFGGQRRQLRAYMDELEKIPQVRPSDVKEFERFADLVRITVVKLKAENHQGELGAGSLHSLLVKKLADRHLEMYSRWLGENNREQSVISLGDWLKEEARIRIEAKEMAHGIRQSSVVDNVNRRSNYDRYKGRTSFTSIGEHGKDPPARNRSCDCCGDISHQICRCKQYRYMKVDERWQLAKERRLCFRCLRNDHHGKDCRRSQKCGVDNCQLTHHSLLHDLTKQATKQQKTVGKDQKEVNPPGVLAREGEITEHRYTMTTSNKDVSEAYSLRTVQVWIKAVGKKVKVNAILDDASNETFLNEDVAAILGIQEPYEKVKIHVLNDSVETFESMPMSVVIESVDGQFSKEIKVRTYPRKVTGNYRVEDWAAYQSQWSHLRSCNFPKPAKDGMVDMLIGVDNADLHYSMVDLQTPSGGPVARRGPLGWTCIGTPEARPSSDKRSHIIRAFLSRQTSCVQNESCCDIDQSLKRFWEIESYGTTAKGANVMTEEETRALDLVKKSLQYENGRYNISTPWKENKPKLPDNRRQAISRLNSTEKNLKQNGFVAAEYQKTIKDYVREGYLRKIPPEEKPPPEVWYLPHFPIVRMDKSTTKVRIVFDCSAKFEGLSLNDVIHAGPKLQKDLFDVLTRFRRNPIALVCDIKEMFLQIEIEKKDRPYFRILWRDLDANQEPEEYEFTRVVFGKNSAPMESQFVAQENARRHQKLYPFAAETILKPTYMDDSLDSVAEIEQGVELYQQLNELWRLAGMQARKWISNSPEVMAVIPEEDRATEFNINDGQYPIIKTLGLSWNSTDDVFTLPTLAVAAKLKITKRNILQKIATVFDPLGFVSPVLVKAKILLQELWSRGYDWDESVADDIANEIRRWFDQLPALGDIKVPRKLRELKPISSMKVITFVDASQEAYGAVAYLRHSYEDGTVTNRMIASKSKVAPLIPTTIPRLELMAAILGLRLTQSILKVLELPMKEVTFYSDSMDVLWWIRGRGRDFRSFVANRIGEVQMYSEPSQWQHVPTNENPADLCTRGATPNQLIENALWWTGPAWLQKDTAEWPKMKNQMTRREKLEAKSPNKSSSIEATSLLTHLQDVSTKEKPSLNQDLIDWRLEPRRYSSWTRLVHIHARVIRVLHNMQKDGVGKVTSTELQPEEIKDAQEDIIKSAQKQKYPEEYKALTTGRTLPTNSQLLKLNPQIDENGIIRSNSRLRFAEYLPFDTKFPVILPRGNWITKLIVKHHEQANHSGGTNFILAQLSQRYWIIAAREEIQEWEKSCNECKRRKNKFAKQIMAPLPNVRLRFTYRPFDQTAVDFAGPFFTKQGRGIKRQKRWLCVFTCLSIRAVHLEMAWGLDTNSFLNTLARFTSRRGVPKEIVSDCGTNFVGAVSELKELHNQLDKEKIKHVTVDKGVQWKFNPPAAPHFGGAHEIMVKAAKRAVYGILKNGEVTDEELITAFSGVESLINSRPLTYQTVDPRDDVPLTPNHFLHGQMGGDFAPETEWTTFNPNKRWSWYKNLYHECGEDGYQSTCQCYEHDQSGTKSSVT